MAERGAAYDFPIPTQSVYERDQPPRGDLSSHEQASLNIIGLPKKIPGSKSFLGPRSKIKTSGAAFVKVSTSPKKASIASRPTSLQVSLNINDTGTLGRHRKPPLSLQQRASLETDTRQRQDVIDIRPSGGTVATPSGATQSPISGADAVGLAAAREAQLRLEEQDAKIKALEEEILHLQEELGYSVEEMARRQLIIRDLESDAATIRETAIPLDEARYLATQILRKGYALSNLAARCEPASISQQQIRYGFNCLCRHAFGDEAREELLARRRAPGLTPDGLVAIDFAPKRLQAAMRLVRTEQLLLLEENEKVFSELHMLSSAMRADPETATTVFRKFQKAKSKLEFKPALQPSGENQRSGNGYVVSLKKLSGETSLQGRNFAFLVMSRVLSCKLQLQCTRALAQWRFLTAVVLSPSRPSASLQHAVWISAFYLLRNLVQRRLQKSLWTLRYGLFASSSLTTSSSPTVAARYSERRHPYQPLPQHILETTGFAIQPWYFDNLPSNRRRRQQLMTHGPPA